MIRTIAFLLVVLVSSVSAMPGLPTTAKIGGRTGPDGTELQCDLPGDLHKKNVGGSDGAGLCVFTSIGHAAVWQNVDQLKDFQAWMRRRPGGGYPSKVDAMIRQYCQEQGLPEPRYLNIEGNDLDILKLACKTGRMASATYGYSPTGRYSGQRISHMVNVVHADEKWFVVLDNNYPGADAYEWLTPQEFARTFSSTGGQGWAVILLSPPPPPLPWN